MCELFNHAAAKGFGWLTLDRLARGLQFQTVTSFLRATDSMRPLLFVFMLVAGFATVSPAQSACVIDGKARPDLQVATRIIPPLVTKNGQLSGFSVELWSAIAEQMQCGFAWRETGGLKTLLATVETGEVDAAIAAISITAERERTLDFSQPILESGLQVLVNSDTSEFTGFDAYFHFLGSRSFLEAFVVLFILILVPAPLIYWVERREGSLIKPGTRSRGLFKSIWWSAATLAGQSGEMPTSPAGRIIAFIWMLTSILFITYFTAAMTSAMTVRQLEGSIAGVKDLPGKRIGTITGSTSADFLATENLAPVLFPDLSGALLALTERRVDALVYDAPPLLYLASHEARGKVRLAGPLFRKESYGIAFPTGSPLRKSVNRALLTLRENGAYDRISEKWFANAVRTPQ